MARIVGVLKETFPGERCVAIVPRSVEVLKKSEMTVMVEPSAGVAAGSVADVKHKRTKNSAHQTVARPMRMAPHPNPLP